MWFRLERATDREETTETVEINTIEDLKRLWSEQVRAEGPLGSLGPPPYDLIIDFRPGSGLDGIITVYDFYME